MITISLDEFGEFENIDDSRYVPTLIAGVIYDDQGIEGETGRERKRIEPSVSVVAFFLCIFCSCDKRRSVRS